MYINQYLVFYNIIDRNRFLYSYEFTSKIGNSRDNINSRGERCANIELTVSFGSSMLVGGLASAINTASDCLLNGAAY